MIAALVLLALVASAQVQAFPGSDPVANALTVFPEHPALLGHNVGDNFICLLGYLSKIQDLVSSSKAEIQPIEGAVAKLISNIQACSAQKDRLDCSLQAVRDAWENSAEVRKAAETLVQQAISLATEIKGKCF